MTIKSHAASARPRRTRLTLAVVAIAGITAWVPTGSAFAATVTISGYVYRDLNDNGIRDAAEPGVAGIKVRLGSGATSTVTAADGRYTLGGLPTSGNLSVETGWLRSQCPTAANPTALTCAAGPGPDNDFKVANQFLLYPLAGASSAANVDVGLLPDWPGDGLLPPAGTVPANTVDIAARLSWVSGTCADATFNICRIGDTFIQNAQVYNQGTTALTGIAAKLVVPPGDCLTSLSLITSATAPGITGMTTTPSTLTCGTRLVSMTFAGSLVAAGEIRLAVKGKTVGGPGTSGCVLAQPVAATCTTAEPQSAGWLFTVSHIDQTGDPDSDFCAAGDPRQCPTGVHDKRRNPDEVDPVGHNVDAAVGTITAFDMQMYYQAMTGGPVHPGDAVNVRAWAANETDQQDATQINPGSTVTLYLPTGTGVTLPPKHALFACVSSTKTSSIVVTCTYKGPQSAGLSGPALNLTVTVPATWPSGTTFRSVGCAAPPASQAGAERIPAGASCDLTTQPAATATDNDAEVDLPVS